MTRQSDPRLLRRCLTLLPLSCLLIGGLGPAWPPGSGLHAEESVRQVPPLEISYNFIGQRKMPDGSFQEVVVREGAVLHSHDNLKVSFRTNADCYVYVLLLDSRGKASQLFPHPRISLDNRVQAGRSYEIPPLDDWFWLDEETGTETLYLLASYEHMTGLGEILREMERAGSAPSDTLTRGIDREVEILTRGSRRPARPDKPIHITGVAGRSMPLQITTRGMEEKALSPETNRFKLSDGTPLEKASQVVKGYASCVEVIRFEHR